MGKVLEGWEGGELDIDGGGGISGAKCVGCFYSPFGL